MVAAVRCGWLRACRLSRALHARKRLAVKGAVELVRGNAKQRSGSCDRVTRSDARKGLRAP